MTHDHDTHDCAETLDGRVESPMHHTNPTREWSPLAKIALAALLWIALITLLIYAVTGCTGISKTVTPATAGVSHTVMEYANGKPTKSITDSATSTSAGVEARGEGALKDSTNIDAPTVRLGSAGGGGLGSTTSIVGGSSATALLIGAGVLCIIGGGTCLYLGLGLKPALICFGIGAGLVVSGVYPIALLFVVVVAAVGGIVYLIWRERSKARTESALTAVVDGVAALPDHTASEVKAEIGKQATQPDRMVIAEVKARKGT